MSKTCQNCARATSSTTTAVFPYYCFAYRLYVNPSGCCPMYIPNKGYEDGAKTEGEEQNDEQIDRADS